MNMVVAKFKVSMFLAFAGIVLLALALLIALSSYAFGFSVGPSIVAGLLVFVLLINLIQWLIGPYIINAMYRAVEVKPDDPTYGWLVPLVSEVAMENGLSIPKVYVADVPFPNAFAYGSPLAGKRVAITLALLRILNKEEIKAVLGHELGHLRHRDVELLMAVGLLPAVMYWLGYSLMWGSIFSGGNGRQNNSAIIWLIGIGLIALSFVFNLLVLYINRLREAYADINSALTVPGAARNLQMALAKITASMDRRAVERAKQSSLMKMLFFASPEQSLEVSDEDAMTLVNYWRTMKVPWYADFFSDHPHPAKRIKILDRVYGYQ